VGHGGGALRSRMPGMGLGSNKRRFRKSSACIAPCSLQHVDLSAGGNRGFKRRLVRQLAEAEACGREPGFGILFTGANSPRPRDRAIDDGQAASAPEEARASPDVPAVNFGPLGLVCQAQARHHRCKACDDCSGPMCALECNISHAANRDRSRESSRKWREANPEKVLAISRKWHAANPEKVREAQRRRMAAKRAKGKS
jgi:hypothetical protein